MSKFFVNSNMPSVFTGLLDKVSNNCVLPLSNRLWLSWEQVLFSHFLCTQQFFKRQFHRVHRKNTKLLKLGLYFLPWVIQFLWPRSLFSPITGSPTVGQVSGLSDSRAQRCHQRSLFLPSCPKQQRHPKAGHRWHLAATGAMYSLIHSAPKCKYASLP